MPSVLRPAPNRPLPPLLELQSGDRLTQAEFHRRYAAYPDEAHFELIEGMVVMASPARIRHGEYQAALVFALTYFKGATPGLAVADNATVILSQRSEVQPDVCVRFLADAGGQTQVSSDEYILGGPEWVGEVAHSSASIDLHQKKLAYQRGGVHEYLVLSVEEQELHWFHFKSRRKIIADSTGIFRSRALPGLWIDGPALLECDTKRLIKTLDAGLASPEHAEFVRGLKSARRRG
ncbi:MAG: Uma2 family endonuclease [Planctomycetales bacterium]